MLGVELAVSGSRRTSCGVLSLKYRTESPSFSLPAASSCTAPLFEQTLPHFCAQHCTDTRPKRNRRFRLHCLCMLTAYTMYSSLPAVQLRYSEEFDHLSPVGHSHSLSQNGSRQGNLPHAPTLDVSQGHAELRLPRTQKVVDLR